MSQPTLAELLTARAIIRQQQRDLEAKDDFCHTNGRMKPLLLAESNFTCQIMELEQKETSPCSQ